MTGEGREEGIGKGRRDREGKRMKGKGREEGIGKGRE